MKKILYFIFVFVFSLTISAQHLDGSFINGNDSIVFSDDNVSFSITGFAGLSTVQVGKGNYEFAEDFLLVYTTDYPGPKSTHIAQDASGKDTCRVRVMSISNYPVQGILVESKNNSGKIISAGVTGSDGRIIFTDYQKVSKLTASSMGYHPITIDFSPGNDYVIRIAENDIIENRTVAFRFNKIDNETISLILLSDNLQSDKDLVKELTKLNKRVRRLNLIEKRFTKELPYFTR